MIIDKIKKVNKIEEKPIKNDEASEKMIGKWVKCNNCKEIIYKEELHKNLMGLLLECLPLFLHKFLHLQFVLFFFLMIV